MSNEAEVKTRTALIQVPINAVKLHIEADIIYDDLSLHKADMDLSMEEIVDAWVDGEEWERDNARYVITDIGLASLEEAGK